MSNYSYNLPHTGTLAINSEQPLYEATIGNTISITVYAFGIPPIQPEEIIWINPQGRTITNRGGTTFHDNGTHLMIEGVDIDDNGTFHAQIIRTTVVSTSIDLLVHSKQRKQQ